MIDVYIYLDIHHSVDFKETNNNITITKQKNISDKSFLLLSYRVHNPSRHQHKHEVVVIYTKRRTTYSNMT